VIWSQFWDRLVRILNPLRMGIKTPINSDPFSSDFAREPKKSSNPSHHRAPPIRCRLSQLKAWRSTRTPLWSFSTSRSSRCCTVASHCRQPSPEESHDHHELQPPLPDTIAALGEFVVSRWSRRAIPRRKRCLVARATPSSGEPPPSPAVPPPRRLRLSRPHLDQRPRLETPIPLRNI
jgi:hypothetical protein